MGQVQHPELRVILARPRGFCAGVERAIEIVERALEIYGAPVYVRHQIVHNHRVVEWLSAKGARFVDEVDEVPQGAVVVFSAHGVSKQVEYRSARRRHVVIDATCPLVSKVHREGQRYAAKDYDVVLVGHRGHAEVDGTFGQIDGPVHIVSSIPEVAGVIPRNPDRISYVTQTTLSVDDTREIIGALKQRFPRIVGPDVRDICYATQNRQTAVRRLSKLAEVILVVGAGNSSNSNRLREIGEIAGCSSFLIPDSTALDLSLLENVSTVGITAGASAPEELVQEVITHLGTRYRTTISDLPGITENVRFPLPAELKSQAVFSA